MGWQNTRNTEMKEKTSTLMFHLVYTKVKINLRSQYV